MSKRTYFWAVLAIFSLGCQKEELAPESGYIDADLLVYLERFQEEGARRGISIDFVASGMAAYLEDIDAVNVTGQCYSNSGVPSRLVIDRAFWAQASDIRREFVVFHELGHCLLDRGHLDTARPDGTCASIMHSGLSGCRNAYSQMTRSDYLDELFLEE